MKIIDLDQDKNKINENNYIALGNFDGLHLAHSLILKNLVLNSKNSGCNSSVLLFKEHTLNYLGSPKPKVLTSLDDKLDILKNFDIDQIFLVDFQKIKFLDSQSFVEKFLIQKLKVKGVFVGFDYKFGKLAKGNIESLISYKNKNLIDLWVEDPIVYNGETISSTYIKNSIESNNLDLAEELLGRPYYLKGSVVEGKKLGSKLGFPTANIKLFSDYALPSEGVYYSEIIYNGKSYKAATSLGKNMTMDEKTVKIEAHIIDFNQQIYGEKIRIRFIKKLREMTKFIDLESLTNQVKKDIADVKNMINLR